MKPQMWLAFRFDVGPDFRFLISRVTGAPVHVEVLFGDIATARAYGADWKGVRQTTWSHLRQRGKWRLVRVPVYEAADLAQAEIAARGEVGWSYDYLGVLYTWWAGKIAGDGARRKRFCSEFAAQRVFDAGVELPITRAGAYTPRRLWDTVAQSWGAIDA